MVGYNILCWNCKCIVYAEYFQHCDQIAGIWKQGFNVPVNDNKIYYSDYHC